MHSYIPRYPHIFHFPHFMLHRKKQYFQPYQSRAFQCLRSYETHQGLKILRNSVWERERERERGERTKGKNAEEMEKEKRDRREGVQS